MSNRIGRYCYFDSLVDLHRAYETVSFCEAIRCLYGDPKTVPAEEMTALTILHREAADLIGDMGGLLPRRTMWQ